MGRFDPDINMNHRLKGFRAAAALVMLVFLLAVSAFALADGDPIRVSSLSEPQSVISEQDVSISFKIYYCSRYSHLSIKYFIRNVFVRCVLCAVIPFLVGLYFVSEFEGQGFLRLCLTSVICTTILIMVLFSIGMNKQEKNLIVRNMFTNMH